MSVSANIVEGSGTSSQAELCRFFKIARASATELEYHLLLSHDLELLPPTDYRALLAATIEVKRMLTGMVKTVDASRAAARGERRSPRASPL